MQELPSSDMAVAIAQPTHVCPEWTCNFVQKITFGWITPLMRKGYSQPLEARDIWDLPPTDKVESVGSTFEKHWTHQMESGVLCSKRCSAYG